MSTPASPTGDGLVVPREVSILSGRISISLSRSKARQLNDYGVYNLTSLYLILARADPATNGPKLLELMDQVRGGKNQATCRAAASQLWVKVNLRDRLDSQCLRF